MSMTRLAFLNFKQSFRNHLALIVSQAFTVLVLFNFQVILSSDAFVVLGTRNKAYIDMLVQMVSFVLGCFMFFFIWYSTDVFLTSRKKAIGLYVFMGLSNEKIGQMYLIETLLTGLSALALGLGFGHLSAGLFQMLLLTFSQLEVEILFLPGPKPMLTTALIYLAIDLLFSVKGYLDIARSSVLSLLSAARQTDHVRQSPILLWVRAILGTGILSLGYGLALKEAREGVMANALAAVILVTAGVYLLFSGAIPVCLAAAAADKKRLYQKQRVLWVNSMLFRMRKNHRTYAIVCVLLLCSVTALATGFAMKDRYETIVHFEDTYTFQLLSSLTDLDERARSLIEEESPVAVSTRMPILYVDASLIEDDSYYSYYAILSYPRLEELAEAAGLDFPFEGLADDEVIQVGHPTLLSLITDQDHKDVRIGGQTFHQIADSTIPYLGYLQERMRFYVVSGPVYERLLPLGQEVHTYSYKIADPSRFPQVRDRLDGLVQNHKDRGLPPIARVAIDPASNELDWIKVLYSLCLFMFMVFILASGSILFMKLYNDAFEERERFQTILKMGFDRKLIKRAIAAELGMTYALIFLVMGISSFFSVGALGKMMFTDLTLVNLLSGAVVLGGLGLWYLLSVWAYGKNAGV
ncbi:MAG: ABC transporter permease [Lachnospiraceae bacterium]|nr:ABC transporter permease [Lachnospiraceae bacterium]